VYLSDAEDRKLPFSWTTAIVSSEIKFRPGWCFLLWDRSMLMGIPLLHETQMMQSISTFTAKPKSDRGGRYISPWGGKKKVSEVREDNGNLDAHCLNHRHCEQGVRCLPQLEQALPRLLPSGNHLQGVRWLE